VSLFLYTFSNFENRLLSKEIIIFRNNKEAQQVSGERHGGGEYQLGHPTQAGDSQHIKFDSNLSSGPDRLKNNIQILHTEYKFNVHICTES
jgi:hypothetical protein